MTCSDDPVFPCGPHAGITIGQLFAGLAMSGMLADIATMTKKDYDEAVRHAENLIAAINERNRVSVVREDDGEPE